MVKLITQNHHIIYDNPEHKQKEVIVKIYKGEHWILTQLQRRRNISEGFIKQVKVWLALNDKNGVDLNE